MHAPPDALISGRGSRNLRKKKGKGYLHGRKLPHRRKKTTTSVHDLDAREGERANKFFYEHPPSRSQWGKGEGGEGACEERERETVCPRDRGEERGGEFWRGGNRLERKKKERAVSRPISRDIREKSLGYANCRKEK